MTCVPNKIQCISQFKWNNRFNDVQGCVKVQSVAASVLQWQR